MFAGAREINDVSTACRVLEKLIASLNKLVHSTHGVCSSIVQMRSNVHTYLETGREGYLQVQLL